MASQNSTLYTAQTSLTRDAGVSMRPYQKALRFAEFTITVTADQFDDGNDDFILGYLRVEGKVIPEDSRICGVSGNPIGTFKLEKVNEAGTVTPLTGNAVTATDGTPVSFARASGNVPVSFDAEDYLQLTYTESATGQVVAAGDVIHLLVAYLSDELV